VAGGQDSGRREGSRVRDGLQVSKSLKGWVSSEQAYVVQTLSAAYDKEHQAHKEMRDRIAAPTCLEGKGPLQLLWYTQPVGDVVNERETAEGGNLKSALFYLEKGDLLCYHSITSQVKVFRMRFEAV